MNTYTIQSRITYPEENPNLSDDAKTHYKENVLRIENVLKHKGVTVAIGKVLVQKYFVQYFFYIHMDSDVQDIVKNKETLKIDLNTPYIQIRYPVEKSQIQIEAPNYYTDDINLGLNTNDFKLIDFQFLKAIHICIKTSCIDLILLREEIDDIDQSVLLDIAKFIEKEKILKETRFKGRDLDYGKYWYKWREEHRIK